MMGYTFLSQNPAAAPSESSTASFIYAYHHPTTALTNDFPERPPSPLKRCAPASFRKDMKRIKWTDDLHLHFLKAVEKLGPKAVPSRILHHMGVKAAGLTRNQIASHLQKYRTDLEQLKKSLNEKKGMRKKKNKSPASNNVVSAPVKSATPPQSTATSAATTTTFVSYPPEVTLSPSPTLAQSQLQPQPQLQQHSQRNSLVVDSNASVYTQMSPSTTLATTVLTTPEPSYGREILDKSFYYSVPVLDFENDEVCRFAFEELISTILEGQPNWQPATSSLEVEPSCVTPGQVL